MIKHYCEKCGKEVRKWLVCTVETDTDLTLMDTVPNEEVEKMKNLIDEYEICYDCMAKFFKPKDNKNTFVPDPSSIVRHAIALKRRAFDSHSVVYRRGQHRYSDVMDEEEES